MTSPAAPRRSRRRWYLVATAVLIVAGMLILASVAGLRAYTYGNPLVGSVTRHHGGGAAVFATRSGTTAATFNFTLYQPSRANSSASSMGVSFLVSYAGGMNLDYLNLTFWAPAPELSIRLDGPNYYTAGYPPIQVAYTNISASGPGQTSAEVLTMRGFPPEQNPTAVFGMGIIFSAGTRENDTGATNLSVTVGLSSPSATPFVGEGFTGTQAFNLDDA